MERTEGMTRNLQDAGCDAETVQRFWQFAQADRWREALALLRRHRGQLLERCHRVQREIDCLDYLVYQLERRS